MMSFAGAFAAFLTIGAIVYKATGFVMQTVLGGKVKSAWVPQVVTLILSMLASFLFQLNILPLIAQEFGGHLADLPLWAAYLLTGIAIAAIAEGAVTAFNGTVTAIASIGDKPAQTPVAPAQDVRRFW